MPKNILTHRLSNGTLAIRKSTRVYQFVVVADLLKEEFLAGKRIGPGPAVVAYTNSASVSPFARQWGGKSRTGLRVEHLNNGERVVGVSP